ncbi:hypothetical protein [Plastoroseomonas arctica]|uniref:Uncharacterized protein n=1 Tax=Plastoroseomonas arctica TaxID=1509237 RepID=A0AAF1K3K7_9PROT|nr:hypothetical protein [Plastoroseomonas arctica]MBR0655115.1 hypothetical protein [Plastoroseomonas arctica]
MACLLSLLALGGCIAGTIHVIGRATGLKPPAWDGYVQVATEPPGQRCTAERDGQVLAVLAATPGRLEIPRSAFPYEMRCVGPGTLETVHVFRPEPDPGAFVPLPTGVVGIAMLTAAVASGSINRFPPEVAIVSPPAEFDDAAARDAWFAPRAAAIAARFGEQEREARQPCLGQPESTVCEPRLAQIALRRADVEASLAAQRAAVRLASGPELARAD